MTKLIFKDEDLAHDKITYDCEVFTKDNRLLTWLNKVFDTEFKKVYSTENRNVKGNKLDTSFSKLLIVKQDNSVVMITNYEFGSIKVL